MNSPSSIRLLGTTDNERGDLFTRLAKDLFFSLGYDNLELDIPKPGRELDIQGEHRFEPRRVLAECKAHAAAMGGAELNKFLGVLTRERMKYQPRHVAGYFVSLGGFTGTSILQEKESGDDAIILFDAAKVIAELQSSRVIVSITDAAERAGQCVHSCALHDAQIESAELLGHKDGYLWAIYFTCGKERTHFALIHADGTAIAPAMAKAVVRIDRKNGGSLHTLSYLAPATTPSDTTVQIAEALKHYCLWIGEEFGHIQLDGMPADSDLSATKLRLEKLFVPLKAIYPKKPRVKAGRGRPPKDIVEPIGKILAHEPHLALLASPGGGKSTLLKRLATAYAFPERRKEVSDDLPNREWLPLYLRCRDLRDRAQRPLLELLHGITAFANMEEPQAASFRIALSEALRSGSALLLVDGLDEISDEGARRTFAYNLRTFIGMFPQVALVVTSRLAGFRDIAGVIVGVCKQAMLAPLDEDDVRRLCVSWHVEVVANSEKVRADATDLAKKIWNNPHIRTLVENPLLLTTLLVVKRSNGEIPPTRAQLYQEAVRVLVRTWNVEGYAPLDEAETLARLSYVACAMMQRGIQVIGQVALIRLLNEAATELEAELQFAKVSPSEFIQRIEYRSSLLTQTGYQRVEYELQPVFEFRHLTFQEYLAARGFVSEQYPGRNNECSLVDILAPHFGDERWKELIPLAAVLAGRKADSVLQRLTAASGTLSGAAGSTESAGEKPQRILSLLVACLLEEVTITQATLRNALTEVGLKVSRTLRGSVDAPVEALANGKFGSTFREVVEKAYFSGTGDWSNYDYTLSRIVIMEAKKTSHELLDKIVAREVAQILTKGTREERISGAFLVMRMAFDCRDDRERVKEFLGPWAKEYRTALLQMLMSGDLPSVQAACWAMAWIGSARVWTEPTSLEVLRVLLDYWQKEPTSELARKAAWALSTQPLHARNTIPNEFWGSCDDWLVAQWEQYEKVHNERSGAAVVVAWYRRSPWSDAQLVEKLQMLLNPHSDYNIRVMLSQLGLAGTAVLRKWRKKVAFEPLEPELPGL